jgi:hypothetical protein
MLCDPPASRSVIVGIKPERFIQLPDLGDGDVNNLQMFGKLNQSMDIPNEHSLLSRTEVILLTYLGLFAPSCGVESTALGQSGVRSIFTTANGYEDSAAVDALTAANALVIVHGWGIEALLRNSTDGTDR